MNMKSVAVGTVLLLSLVLCLTTLRITDEYQKTTDDGSLVDIDNAVPIRNVMAAEPSSAARNDSGTSDGVWKFKYHKSSPSAVVKVRGMTIEPIHPYLVVKAKGKSVAVKASDLRIRPLLTQINSTLLPQAKKVWIDVGARMFSGSTMWFLRRYPDARSFGAVAFELLDLKQTYDRAPTIFRSFEYIQKAAWTHSNGVMIKGYKMARVSDGVIEQKGDKRAEWSAPSVDLAEFLKQNFTRNDFVALKMDIEGGEWTLIPHLIRTGAMDLVDELFLECHPIDFDDYVRQPGRLPQICIDFINDLRDMGIYCHRWF